MGVFASASAQTVPRTEPEFYRYFEDKALRMDVIHSGTAGQELFSLDETFQEPLWPGSRTNLIDTLNLGAYYLTVADRRTNRTVYSYAFASIFSEWRTTKEAGSGVWRSFSESIRFPWPKAPVKVTVEARDKENVFRPVWTVLIDPSDPEIVKNAFFQDFRVLSILHNGDPHQKVDLVILPDGYSAAEMTKFRKDARRFTDTLFAVSPFRERRSSFNVTAVEAPSVESGVDDPNAGVYRDNLLSCSFNAFNTDRYALTWNNKTVRKLASRVPYDQVIIMMNTPKYGGGGIFNLYAISCTDNFWSGYILIHEFGHAFGGLGDEYYTSETAYEDLYPAGVEPWEPNIAQSLDRGRIKWQAFLEPGVPLPTPWDQNGFDMHESDFHRLRQTLIDAKRPQTSIDSLTLVSDRWKYDFLHSRPHWGRVGAYEGCGYAAKGLYRPYADCLMFSRSHTPFDPVCRRAIENVIDFHTR
ncbi:MAG TPA: M64 family metallopeptidase [bacterium]